MKRILFFPILFLLFSLNIKGETWAYSFGNKDFSISDGLVKEAPDLSLYVVSEKITLSYYERGLVIFKVSSIGEVLWKKELEVEDFNYLSQIELSPDGGIFILGKIYNTSTGTRTFLIKMDENGNILWNKCYSALNSKIKALVDGSILFVAFGSGRILVSLLNQNGEEVQTKISEITETYVDYVFQDSSGNFLISFRKSIDNNLEFFLVKMDENLNLLWAKKYSGILSNLCMDIEEAEDGYFLGAWVYNSQRAGYDIGLIKIDYSGNILWQKSFSLKDLSHFGSMAKTAEGDILLIGSSRTDVFSNDADIYVLKIDPSGNLLWQRVYAGKNYDYGGDILISRDANIVFLVTTYSYGINKPNILLAKLNKDGTLESCSFGIPAEIGIYNSSLTCEEIYPVITDSFLQVFSLFSNTKDIELVKKDICQDEFSNILITPVKLKKAIKGSYFYQNFTPQGGLAPYNFSLESGSLPPGIALSSEGEISGIPSASGIWNFKIKVEDSNYFKNYFYFQLKVYEPHPKMEWGRVFGGGSYDYGYAFDETLDGGFVISGKTNSFGPLIWTLKVDYQGEVQFQKAFGRQNYENINAVLSTSDFGYLIAGNAYYVSKDAILYKLDQNGNKLWHKYIGGYENDTILDLAEDYDGNYIFVGRYASDPEFGISSLWVGKIDQDGNLIRSKIYGGAGYEQGYILSITSDGGCIVLGFTDSYGSPNDLWILKLDEYLDPIWQKRFPGNWDDWIGSIIETLSGDYILTALGGGYEAVMKLDRNGNLIWARNYDFYIDSIIESNDGNFLAVGYCSNCGLGYLNASITKLDPYGDILWRKIYGGINCDTAFEILQCSDGDIAIFGYSESFSNNFYDFWLLKLDEEGNLEGCDIIYPLEGNSYPYTYFYENTNDVLGFASEIYISSPEISFFDAYANYSFICPYTPYCVPNLGDVNLNLYITSMDASYVLQYVVGLLDLTEEEKCRGDVNLNGELTSMDSAYILICSVGKCSDLGAEFYYSCKSHNNCR
ncbi:MAG: dockerin type I repeat-containing protein [Thermoanaerobaculia bacterium]